MDGVTIATPLRGGGVSQQRLEGERSSYGKWFSAIPPERRGLEGEYDYFGLSKRVTHRLRSQVDGLRQLKVRQRGRVVLLSGKVCSAALLRDVVKLVLSIDGVDAVETYGVRLPDVG